MTRTHAINGTFAAMTSWPVEVAMARRVSRALRVFAGAQGIGPALLAPALLTSTTEVSHSWAHGAHTNTVR